MAGAMGRETSLMCTGMRCTCTCLCTFTCTHTCTRAHAKPRPPRIPSLPPSHWFQASHNQGPSEIPPSGMFMSETPAAF